MAAWKDLLTTYNGQTIEYDAQSNPTDYLGHKLELEKGRQLRSFDGNTYTYNANGIRTSKTVNGVKHTYTLDGTMILSETWDSNTLVPMYDNEDSVCGIIYNNEPYYFQKNLQGDVIGIVDKNAELVAKYSYDAWGVCTVKQDTSGVGIATVIPFRYRGYYYDAETGLYYLQSRYYNPIVGRFINADEFGFLESRYNLFNYCNNLPTLNDNPFGNAPAGAIIGAILGFGLGLIIVPYVADLLNLRGWVRNVFIWTGTAAITGLATYIGYYVGEAIFKVYKAAGRLALKVNEAIARGITKLERVHTNA